MEITQVLLIGGAILGGLLTITLGVLFFVSRKSQKVMQSLLMIMTKPEEILNLSKMYTRKFNVLISVIPIKKSLLINRVFFHIQ